MKYFSGSIAEKKISDFQKYDASITKFNDRLELVMNLINGESGELHEFFTTYFAHYYDVSPSQKGWMAEEDAVCRTIEMLGTYLLNSKDIESNRKVKYRFWKSEREFKQYKESQNVNTSTLEAGLDDGVEVIDMFYSNDEKNYKLDTDTKLYAGDLKDIIEIKRLQDAIDRAKDGTLVAMVEKRIDEILPILENEDDIARLKRIRSNVENYVNKWSTNMKDNQILIKEAIKRPIRFKNPLKGEGVPNKLDSFDFMEEKDVKALLPFISRSDLMSDMGVLIYDLNTLIDESNLSSRERDVISLYREGLRQSEISSDLDISKQSVKKMEERIAKKIVKVYEEKIEMERSLIRNKMGVKPV